MHPELSSTTARRLLARFLSFSVIQAAQMLLPLLALPYLARVLGKETFGLVMYLNVIPLVIAFVLDWGFVLGGGRLVARHRQDQDRLASIWAHGLLAKALLVTPVALGLVLYFFLVPHPDFGPDALFWAFLGGVARGFSPLWFFQGLTGGNIHRLALWDTLSSALLLVLTFVLVQEPGDWTVYLALFACCKLFSYGLLCVQTTLSYSCRARVRQALAFLWQTKVFLAGGIAGQAYTNWSHLVLGTLLPARDMGFFLLSDKVVRAIVSLSNPVAQVLFPEMCAMHTAEEAQRRLRLQRLTLLVALLTGLGAGGLLWLLAGQVILLALGDVPQEAVQALCVMAATVPLLTMNLVLSQQILVPMGKERLVTLAQCAAACTSIPVTLFLALSFGLQGAVFLPVLAEGTICLVLLTGTGRHSPEIFLLRRRESGNDCPSSLPARTQGQPHEPDHANR